MCEYIHVYFFVYVLNLHYDITCSKNIGFCIIELSKFLVISCCRLVMGKWHITDPNGLTQNTRVTRMTSLVLYKHTSVSPHRRFNIRGIIDTLCHIDSCSNFHALSPHSKISELPSGGLVLSIIQPDRYICFVLLYLASDIQLFSTLRSEQTTTNWRHILLKLKVKDPSTLVCIYIFCCDLAPMILLKPTLCIDDISCSVGWKICMWFYYFVVHGDGQDCCVRGLTKRKLGTRFQFIR